MVSIPFSTFRRSHRLRVRRERSGRARRSTIPTRPDRAVGGKWNVDGDASRPHNGVSKKLNKERLLLWFRPSPGLSPSDGAGHFSRRGRVCRTPPPRPITQAATTAPAIAEGASPSSNADPIQISFRALEIL